MTRSKRLVALRGCFVGTLGPLCLLAVLLLPYLFTSSYHGDEFTNLANGLRMLHGEVIYRDFFELTAPLSHAFAAWLFGLAGPSLWAARLGQSVLLLVAGWQLAWLARRLGVGPLVAWLPALALVLGLYRAWPGFSHHWVAWPFALGALQAGMAALDGGRARNWMLAGGLAGLCALAMQSDGLVFASVLVAIALGRGLARRDPASALASAPLAVVAGFGLPVAITAIALAQSGALGAARDAIWVWPLQHYKTPGGFNDVAYGSDWLAELAPMLPSPLWLGRAFHLSLSYLLAPIAIGGGAVCLASRRPWTPADWRLLLVIACSLACFALVSRGRADYPRVAMYAVPALLATSALAGRFADRFRGRWFAGLGHGLLAAYSLTGGFLLARYMLASPAAWLRLESPDQRIRSAPVLAYLRGHSGPSDRIVAMPNGGVFYFYGRPPATRYPLIWPRALGFTTAEDLARVRDEIARERPKFVVLGPYGVTDDHIAAFLGGPLPAGYQRVGERFWLQGGPVYLFERSAGVAPAPATAAPGQAPRWSSGAGYVKLAISAPDPAAARDATPASTTGGQLARPLAP